MMSPFFRFPSSPSRRICGLLCLLLSIPVAIRAQQNQPTATVSGTVNDPDNELIPGATVTLTPATGKATVITSGSDGSWRTKVAPGTYAFTITMPGFAAYVRQGVKITSAQVLTLNAKMVIETTETVQVTASANSVSVDPDSNASSTVLSGAALDALSDDPDELSDELSALAGPSAGPNGGQIYIDGFTGGQLPPKSSIREIRINQNPFSAQYDRPGFGRVEVFTKPGTDKFHGSAQLNGNDKSLNTGSPFLGSTAEPGYHTVLFFGNLTGPIRKNASFALGGSYRGIQDNYIVDPSAIYATSQTSGVLCQPGQAGCSIFQLSGGSNTGGYTFAQFAPQTRWDISPRLDLGLGEKNSLTARFQYESNTQQSNGIGGPDLVSTGYNIGSSEDTIQISDTQIFSSKIINETRFEFQRETSNQNPYSTAPTVSVLGAFTGGGASSGLQADYQNHIEAQNYTSIALAKNFIRFGGRLRTTGETNTSFAGQNGTLTYTNINAYATNMSTSQAYPTAVNQYSQTIIEQPTIQARETDLGLYAEDDWKIRPNITLSYGLRYEAQNFIHDKHDFAPRIAVAYGLSKKTVLRAGFGLFYDRFQLGNELGVFRNNLTNQQQYVVSAAAITSACTPTTAAMRAANGANACLNFSSATPSQLTQTTIAPTLRSPYIEQTNIGVDQQLIAGMTLSVNYQNIHGVHQFVSQNTNYPINGAYPFPAASATTLPNIIYQYQSEGVFEQNQLVLSTNYRGRHGSLFGYYLLNNANSDTSGANSFSTKPYDLKADYGRASFSVRSRLFMGGSFSAPHNFTLSPFLVANSGQPYNITTGRDNNNDSIYNDRPAFADGNSGNCSLASSFNAEVGNANYTEIPVNYCTGPANFSMNLRVVKTFGFGPSTASQAQGAGQGGPGGPPGGGRGPGGGGRGGPGGGFGGPGGGSNTGKRYNVSIGAQGQNIFNIADRGTPVGILSSPTFGTATQLSGMFFTSNSAVRRIQLQASFNF